MRFITFILCISLTFFACNSNDKLKKPDNLISKDKMVDVIIDLTLMSSAKGVDKPYFEGYNISFDSVVFKKHNIDSAQFSLSNEYYAYNVETYAEIYTRVKDSVKRLNNKYKALSEKETKNKRKKDSIVKTKRRDSLNQLRRKQKLIKPIR